MKSIFLPLFIAGSGVGGSGGDSECADIVTDCSAGGAGGEGGSACVETRLGVEFETIQHDELPGATDFQFLPGERGDVLFALREGTIRSGRINGPKLELNGSWDIPEEVFVGEACGLTNILLDPEFSENGFIYVTYCTSVTETLLVRYTWSQDDGLSDRQVIFETQLKKQTDEWHRFGSLGFEEDGETLWMLVGDHFIMANGQRYDEPMGSLIRILPNREAGEGGHEIPPGNMASVTETEGAGGAPFEDADPSVFAYGFRSPFRGTRDASGRVFVGDVGLGTFEEVNLVTEVGQNFGWAEAEGPCLEDCEGFTDPLVYFGRASDEQYVLDDPDTEPAAKRAVWVGEVYQSPRQDRYCGLMDDVVVFGDFFTGWVRALRVDAEGEIVLDQSIGHLTAVTQWRSGPDGYAYVLDLNGGFQRVVPDWAD